MFKKNGIRRPVMSLCWQRCLKNSKPFTEIPPLHRAVVVQTLESKMGEHSFGIHMPNYSAARKRLFDLIEEVLDSRTPDNRVGELLAEFDREFSIPSQSE